jgi:methylmalonyl-CoA/ethylmalonyl-CoA epimerase
MKDKLGYEIAHIAVAVPNLEQMMEQLKSVLGHSGSPIEEVPEQKVKLRFSEIGGVRFEFLEPTSKDSPISKFLEKRGSGIHHIAVYVNNLAAKLNELKSKGVALINETPQKGAEGCLVAFLHPKAIGGVLVELIEDPHKK